MNRQAEALFEAAPCHFERVCGGWVLIEQGPVCGVCRAELGDYLQPLQAAPAAAVDAGTVQAGAEPQPPAESTLATGSAATLARLRHLLPASPPPPPPDTAERRNQRCWMCEERRTCIQVGGRWECRTCRTIT